MWNLSADSKSIGMRDLAPAKTSTPASLAGARDQSTIDRLVPLVLVDIVDHEVAVELPIGPGPMLGFGGASDGGGVGDARIDRPFVVGTELTEEDRALVRLRPDVDGVEFGLEQRAVGIRAPRHAERLVLRNPGR